MPLDTLQLASDPINNSSRYPYDISRYVAHSRLRQDPHHTRITKIGLIDPDDPTEEDEQSHVDKSNTSSKAGVLDSLTQSIRRPLLLIDWDDKCGSNR